MANEFDKRFRKWKKASAPQRHIEHLIKSPMVDASIKLALRAERNRLNVISEPLRLAALAVRETHQEWLERIRRA